MIRTRDNLLPNLMLIFSLFLYSSQVFSSSLESNSSLFAPSIKSAFEEVSEMNEMSEIKESESNVSNINSSDISNIKYQISTQSLISHLGKQDEAIVTITNTSSSELLKIEPLQLPLPLQLQNETCMGELHPSQSCIYKVNFSPDSLEQNGEIDLKIIYSYGQGDKILNLKKLKYRTIPKNVINLSQFDEVYSSLNIGTVCADKIIYANGNHNIPIFLTLNITDTNYKKVNVNYDEVYGAVQIFVRRGNTNQFITKYNEKGTYNVLNKKNKFSRCMKSPTNHSYSEHKLFFSSSNGGENIIIGGKIDYINRKGEIKSIQTSDNGYLNLHSFDKIIYPTENLFHLVQEKSTNFGFTASTRSVIKVSPKVENYPNLYHYRLKSFSLTDTTFGEHQTTGLRPLKFKKEKFNLIPIYNHGDFSINYKTGDNYEMPINYNYNYGRKFGLLDLVSLKHKPNNIDSIIIDDSYFSLASFQANDLALITQSYCYGCTHVSADVYFKLTMEGFDAFGNDFKFISDSRQNNLYL
ncbi:hypothetical protein [Fluviispira multicolorata]|uniref:Uncharacterized protein n=1 Tax=Fluviispira multicolorata TaxID=2654512 RepID=A0A833N4T3_9BACT|nr:hypothetical protein [Fluviispira multicolorata]KAB8033172.1 hypothetical protein GCL57_00310 [Fluviispira multicolorata]